MPDSPITAAPTAPAPSQMDTNRTAPQVEAPFNDAFADLDKMAGEPPVSTKAPAARHAERKAAESAKAANPPKPAEPAPERPGTQPLEPDIAPDLETSPKPEDKPADIEVPKDDGKPPAEAKPKQGPWQMLREAQAKIKELESKAPKSVDSEALKAAEERVAKAEAARVELEKRIELADYTQSEDYAKNFHEPFVNAYSEAREMVAKLKMTDPESGESRQATAADFDSIMRTSDPEKAAEMIDAMFGTGAKAAEVAAARREILKLNSRRLDQIEAKKGEAAKTQSSTLAERQKAQAEVSKAYTEALDKITTDRKQWFAPDDDAKGNEILAKSREIADMAFGKVPEGKKPLSPVEMARLHAVVHAKATGFDRVVHRLAASNARIKALEAEIAEFKGSEPAGGEGKSGKPSGGKSMSPMQAAEAALESMAT